MSAELFKPDARFAVIRADRFAIQALRRTEAALGRQPIGLVDAPGAAAGRIVAVSAEAEARGVAPGMAAPLAMARCPEIALRRRSAEAEAEAQAALLAAAFSLSPRAEATAAGVCTVDLRGADAVRTRRRAAELAGELAAAGLAVSIGLARTPWLAEYAANGPAVRELEDERGFLDPLPVAVAEPPAELADILLRWGVHTLGAVLAIPKAEFGRRLGAAGLALWERASGEAARSIVPARWPERFEAAWTFPQPVETLEPVLFILRRFVDRLAMEVTAAGWAVGALAVALDLEDEARYARELPLPEPTGEADRLFRILHTHLEQVRTAAAVQGVRLVVRPARPLVKQPGLFDTGLKDPQGFSETLARLAALVGPENVGAPEPARTPRPDSGRLVAPEEAIPPPPAPPVHPAQGLVLRRFRPPTPARVALAEGRPDRVACGAAADPQPVVACRGPWRESGEWWAASRWEREVWQVELAAGGVYQLTLTGATWAVEGMLD
jgi:protein ImuB